MLRKKVYLIPGTMCNERLWVDFLSSINNLSGSCYEFIHINIPRNKSFSQLSEYLSNFFVDEQVHIIGFSLGGYIASHFAVTYPHRVNQAFIIANTPCILPLAEQHQRQELIEFVSRYGYKGMSNERALKLLDSQELLSRNDDAEKLDELINIMITMDAELGEEEFLSQLSCTTKRTDLYEKIITSRVPFVFYYSQSDVLINKKWLSELQRESENCVMIPKQGASHMLPLEKPNELAGYVHNWLSTH